MPFNAGAVVAKLKLDTKGFQSGIASSTKGMKGMEKQALGLSKVIGRTLAIGALGALAFGFKKATDAAGKFEKSMANVSTLVDTSVVNIDELSGAVLDMTTEVLKSSEDLSAGLYQVFSAGVTDAADAMEVLRVSAIAATAGLATTRSSVDAITTIMNAYGLAASDATKVSDVLFQTVKFGKITFEELAGSIGTAVPFAAQLDVSIEDLGASIAILTKVGLDARIATTALRSVFASILKPQDEAIKTAKRLGLEWTTAAFKAKGLVKFMEDLKEATKGDIDEIVKLIPERRAANAVLTLTGELMEELIQTQGAMTKSFAVTRVAFKKQEDTYDSQAKKLGLIIAEIEISIGRKFIPSLTNFLKNIIKIFETTNKEMEVLRSNFITNVSKIREELEKPINIPSPIIGGAKFEFFVKNLVTLFENLNKKAKEAFVSDFPGLAKFNLKAKLLIDVIANLRSGVKDLDLSLAAADTSMKSLFVQKVKLEKPVQPVRAVTGGGQPTGISREGEGAAIRAAADILGAEPEDILKTVKELDQAFLERRAETNNQLLELRKSQLDKNKQVQQQANQLFVDQENLRTQKSKDQQAQAFKLFQDFELRKREVATETNNLRLEQLKKEIDLNKTVGQDLQKGFTALGNNIKQLSQTITQNLPLQAVTTFSNSLSNTLGDVVLGAKSAREAFKEFARSFINDLTRMIIKVLVFRAVAGAVGGPAGAAGGGALAQLFGDGGIMKGKFQPITPMANGGVFSQPTMGLVAERPGLEEAVIPLRGGAVPVTFTDKKQEEDRPPVNIINVLDPRQVEAVVVDVLARDPNLILNVLGQQDLNRGV